MVSGEFGKFNELLFENNSSNSWKLLQNLFQQFDFIFCELISERLYETESDEFSRYFDIKDSFNYAREFLYCLNKSYGERFDVLTRAFIDGKPIYTIKPIDIAIDKDNSITDGFINIAYENTARDAWSIVHETFHLFNYGTIDVDGKKVVNLTMRLFTELVSILAEKLYIAFAYNRKYINDNEAAILLNDRIDNTHLSLYITKCEQQYLALNKQGVYITPYIIKQIKKQYKSVPYYNDVWKDESRTHDTVHNAVLRGTLSYPVNIGYLIGEYYSNLILDQYENPKELLIELNEMISKPDVKTSDVMGNCLEKRLKH